MAKKTLYQDLIDLRDRQRREMKIKVVKGKNLSWEKNPQGKMKWYLHPSMRDTGLRSLMFCVQEIPPGSSSGKLKHQGNMVVFFLEGKGHTILDDKCYDWEAGDCMVFPVKGKGVIVQHFNGDRNLPARFLAAEPNLVDVLGVDMGSGFEQLEPAPEWEG